MESIQIIVSDYPDRDSIEVPFKHKENGVWEVDLGDGFEEYADFSSPPTDDEEQASQVRTVQQLLRKEFDVTYGGTPEDLLEKQ